MMNHPIGPKLMTRLRFSVILATFVSTTLSCKFGSTKKQENTISSSKTFELKDILGNYLNLNQPLNSADDVLFKLEMDEPTADAGDKVKLRFSLSDYSFGPNATPGQFLTFTLTKTASGRSETLVNSQRAEIVNDGFNLSGNYLVKQGETLELRVSNIPNAAIGSRIIVSTSIAKLSEWVIDDRFKNEGYYFAHQNEIARQRSLKFSLPTTFSDKAKLYRVEVDLIGMKLNPRELVTAASEQECTDFSPTGKASITWKGATSVTLPQTETDPGECGLRFQGDLVLGGTGSQELIVSGDFDGISANSHLVNALVSISGPENNESPEAAPLSVVPYEATVGSQNAPYRNTFSGLLDKPSQKIRIKVPVKNSLEGLQVATWLNLFYPLNARNQASQSTFNGLSREPQFEAKLTDLAGNPLIDVAGKPLPTLNLISSSRQNISWDTVGLSSPPETGVFLELTPPVTILPGVLISVSLFAETLRDLIEPISPAVQENISLKQKKSGAKIHDWDAPKYEKNAKPLREAVAGKDVLMAMEEIRDTMHLTTNAKNTFKGIQVIPSQGNVIDFSTIDSCLGNNEAAHWSDLTQHYYCLFNEIRSCYTSGIRNTASAMLEAKQKVEAEITDQAEFDKTVVCRVPSFERRLLGIKTRVPVVTLHKNIPSITLRKYIYEQCNISSTESLMEDSAPTNFPLFQCDKENKVFSYAPAPEERAYFSALKIMSDGQFAPKGLQDAVFRYILEAPTFAFNETDQQEIINAFWRVTNPSDPKDCAKRPVRLIDPKDGTHCLPNKGSDTSDLDSSQSNLGFKVQQPMQAPADR